MKGLTVLAILVLAFLSSTNANKFPDSDDSEAVKKVIQSYAESIDKRNAKALEEVIYTNAQFINFNKATNQLTETNEEALVDALEKGKAGGWTRQLNINSVDVNGNTAVAKVELTDAKLKQTGYVTLIKDNGSWKIFNGVYALEVLR
jgi:hypothetical protein